MTERITAWTWWRLVRAILRSGAVPDCVLRAVAVAVAVLGLVLCPGSLEAQSARSLVEEGNRLYEEGRFQEAHERYMEAMGQDPESPVIPFNAGNALYQDADYRRAMEAYQQAIASGDPELAGDAWYNLGNALYRRQQLGPSLEAYKQALRLDPGDVDAKHNLERVLQQMQQQQQQQSQDSSQDQNQQDLDQQGQRDQQPQAGQQDQQQTQGGREQQQDAGERQPPSQPPQGQEEGRDEGEADQPRDRPPEADGQGGGEPRPEEMTEEEARRLLSAIDEDPGDVNRRPASARGRRPSKPW
jgi:Ca-activated chloride channel family protein